MISNIKDTLVVSLLMEEIDDPNHAITSKIRPSKLFSV